MGYDDFLGVGWAFPVGVDSRGRIALARQEHDIEQAIRMILLTPRGQRVMRPEFGCHVHELAFAPNDGATAGLAARYVEEAIGMWEPRVWVIEVNAAADIADPADGSGLAPTSRLLIEVRYEIKATNDRRSLVFPFYTLPGEPEP
jgi:phage baseplate assembly protein W